MREEQQRLIVGDKGKKSRLFKYYYILVIPLVLFLGSIGIVCTTFKSNDSLSSPVKFEGQLVKGSKGAVAVETKECSDIGVHILKKGGNAVDAAIASTLCIGVIDNFATGIGGGGFMLIRSPNGTFEFIDFRETAPAAASRDMFVKNPLLARVGGLAVAIPGEIRGLELAHKRHGKLPWSMLFEPSIRLAHDGFQVTELLSLRVEHSKDWMSNRVEWTDVYFKNGSPVKKGDTIKRPKLANTLKEISINGADAFYKSNITEYLVKKIQSAGGIATLEDFTNYKPVVRPTISTYYHGHKVTTCSEPTSGRILLNMLNVVERFQFKIDGFNGLNTHRLIEAFKFGFSLRTELGDPDFVHIKEREEEISSKDFASTIRKKITDEKTHDVLYYEPKFDHTESHGTMHLSVVDENDGAVSLTSTVNLIFGSHILDENTGVILNDQMDDFSIPGTPNMFGLFPSAYNYVEPLKRPLSSATPIIIEADSSFELAIGGSGGSLIPTATLNAIINILDYGKNIYDAIASPRLHHQLLPNMIIVEPGYSKSVQAELKKRRHQIFEIPLEYCVSAVQVVKRTLNGNIEAASDPRKMGMASAY
ncbi:gamma-glutamyltranspeptidase [Sporodiniella umbellata]|nr:gamma-glutamyltranspeptidase [Sporodiniella umbellata]